VRSRILTSLVAVAAFAVAASAQVTTLSHSTNSTTVTAGNMVACGGGGFTNANQWAREYVLGGFGIVNPMQIANVTFGVETVNGANGQTTITVNFYTDPVPTPGTISAFASLNFLGSESFNLPDRSTPHLITYALNTPINVSPADKIIVEISTPNQTNQGNFYLGSNTAAETSPTFLRSAACAITNHTTTTAIGFPNAHAILNIGLIAPGTPHLFPGTNEDLKMSSSVGPILNLSGGFGNESKTLNAGDLVSLSCTTPNGTFAGGELLLLAQGYFTGNPPVGAFPGIAINTFGGFVALGGATPLGSLTLPPFGFTASFGVPVFLGGSGISFVMQYLVPTASAQNLIFASTDGHEFNVN
jgi:hypothetical protein